MDDICAPQWVNFTDSCSPQVPVQDYFEKEHIIHKRVVETSDSTLAEDDSQVVPTDVPCDSEEIQQDLNIIKNTPIRIISPKYRSKKSVVEEQITYDQVFSDAMKTLEQCNKLPKAQDMSKKSIQEPFNSKMRSTPIVKVSRSVNFSSVPNKSAQPVATFGSAKVNKNFSSLKRSDNKSLNVENSSIRCSLFKQTETRLAHSTLEKPDDLDDSKSKKENTESRKEDSENKKKDSESKEESSENKEELKEEPNEENNKIVLHDKKEKSELEESVDNDKDNKEKRDHVETMLEKQGETQLLSRHRSLANRTTVLTWQNGRRSLNKRRVSGHYISLAEAVSRFQTETPKRFRTKSNKSLAGKTLQPSILSQRMRPTIPISPALISKNRARAVTVLSQEEREKQQLEEMKKHPIKANPIPPNVLRGPMRFVSKVDTMKKSTTTATTIAATVAKSPSSFSSSSITQQSEKASVTATTRFRSATLHHDKTSSSRNTVTKVIVTNPTGIIVEREEIAFFGVPKDTGASKSVTRIVPFSFEARNKDLQMKKEQRLKNMFETSKIKTEFHAKPAPNFSTQLVAKQQQQQNSKKIQSCPFSFDKRDKNLPKKKEELVKQVLEKDKQLRVFRANPAPLLKPVMVRGMSKERLPIKEKTTKTEKEHEGTNKHDDQENEEPNIIAPGQKQDGKHVQKTKTIEKQKVIPSKNREREEMKAAVPLELNTDKRARERREFDERIKRKDIEEQIKRQEENKKRLEHEKQIKVQLRKLAEVKARPMPAYKQIVAMKSTKLLTDPQSPAFVSKVKSKQA